MSSTATIDKKIAGYVEQLNPKQKKVVLSVVKAFVEEVADDPWEDEAFVKEIDRRTKELESGKVKGYSWDEVKKITRSSLANDQSDVDNFYSQINLDLSGIKISR